MPKIRIREKDLTVSSRSVEDIFTVLIAVDKMAPGTVAPTLVSSTDELDVLTDNIKDSKQYTFMKRVLGLGGKIYWTNSLSVAKDFVTDRNQFNVTFIYCEQEVDSEGADATKSDGPLANAMEICAKRRDCVTVYTKKLTAYSDAENEILSAAVSGDDFLNKEVKAERSKYCFPYLAKSLQEGSSDTKTVLPAGQAYILAFLNSVLEGNSPYKAVAGYKRGIIPVSNLSIGLITEDEIDSMQPRDSSARSINPIVNLTCLGEDTIRILGDRTAYQLESGSDLISSSFASLRIMLCAIKKRLYRVARKYQYESNNNDLWIKYTSEVNVLLDNMKSVGVISSYRWYEEATTEKAKICARLVITPVEPVEDFDLTIELQDEDTVVSE